MESNKRRFTLLFWLAAILGVLALHQVSTALTAPETVPYNQFLNRLEEGRVERVHLKETKIVAEVSREGGETETVHVNRLPGIDETQLVDRLRSEDVKFTGKIEQASWWQTVLLSLLLPLGILAALYFWAMNRMSRQGGAGPLSFGKSRGKIYDQNKADATTFEDVAGVEEARAELREVVSFLRNPKKYADIGAQIPKGVLLVGSPGTGKTLLARAVAGEAGVPFFTLSGSEFVEMFVGVGASRMRDLFEQAKERAPCIIFIDELDAIGKARGGVGAMATHDEREQTLNQLLAEMDGFDPSKGVVIMSATNRPEVLDPALLRAGRFDRRVLVDRPDVRGRKAILEVHARKVHLADDVDLDVIARRTPGMVGADLANVVNEAALAAARHDSKVVTNDHFEAAIDRLQLGLERRSHVLGEEEKRRIAYHETGHALLALSVDHADPVHRVTIIPRSIGALGATLQLPTEDRNLVTRPELCDRIAVMLGGRIAEELALGEISTGAENDLERATDTARQMVTRFGMSEELGPMTYGRRSESRFLQGEIPGAEERTYSEETARRIDAEVRALIERENDRARRILIERRPALERITERLLEEETLERDQLDEILAGGREEATPKAS